MASVERRTDGSWSVRYREAGRRLRVSGIPTRRAAEAVAEDIERSHARGRRYDRRISAAPAWGDVVTAYLTERAATTSAGARTLGPVASALDAFHAYAHGARRGDYRLDRLDEDAIEGFARALLEDGKAPGTARAYAIRVTTMQRWAAHRPEWRHVLRPVGRLSLPSAPAETAEAPTWAEVDRVISHSEGWVRRFLTVQRCTGLRALSVMHLRWDHVDLDDLTIRIPPGTPGLKTAVVRRSGLTLPVPSVLASEMAGWGRRVGWVVDLREPARSGHGAALRDPDDRSHPGTYTIRTCWRRAGLTTSQPTHALRKCHATELVAAGVPMERVDYLQGRSVPGVGGLRYVAWWRRMEHLFRADVEHVPPIDDQTVVPMRAAEGE